MFERDISMMNSESIVFLVFFSCCWGLRVPLEVFQHHPNEHYIYHHRLNHNNNFHRKKNIDYSNIKILYQIGKTDIDLPECGPKVVCNKVDMYDNPWIEKQCKCSGERECSMDIQSDDGHTLIDKTRQYKLCEPVKKLPKCRYFLDTTWTINFFNNNITEQKVHCHCPKNSVTYLTKHQTIQLPNGDSTYQYFFACSPQSRFRCQRKEPCRLFTLRKRQEYIDEVNVDTLCQCPHAHRCPHHHNDFGVLIGKTYTEESIKTYSAYCLPST